ncbi:MAG: preprotein translocase subunit SecE [Halanaerobium sp. 4-GBenrich]|jgi:preprotein translocase subunit SecE|uniref:Protein translocase subunit SecE n=1 Tax=Halanaerobium congolense TaxID=54121 RepID=A0A1G9YDK6_9FIRM|nr:preprotein translocase subunit SecE [Halanaerobium congolense]ODS50569.1 MAG: preprotein translocase subunit SecE [Halanaerobium sp. 4-GBenrich]PUU91364.1 MAG: preprotein translocase subunit SecE [Halanaerobium sp.]PTX15574.1 preprotein translocase subunit SecE [Halanaerobium congolense]PXV63935.1 preprotein translocase subunit SecE [Halanaerobium congolense]SDG07955.1 preprotein translocase subunit SecE [Halanaerobium congolense]
MAKKLGFFGKITKFFKSVKSELKKVNWPNKEEITSNTLVVIVTVIALITFIGLIDLTLANIITPLIS